MWGGIGSVPRSSLRSLLSNEGTEGESGGRGALFSTSGAGHTKFFSNVGGQRKTGLKRGRYREVWSFIRVEKTKSWKKATWGNCPSIKKRPRGKSQPCSGAVRL